MDESSKNSTELHILVSIDEALRSREIRESVEALARELRTELEKERGKALVWRSIPLSLFGGGLPPQIRSSWVFGIRAACETGAERHPRSHQRMMSFAETGDLQVWDGKRWISRKLLSDPGEKIGKRWISIPPGTWHQAVADDATWIVVSFHTVRDNELVEERPDPDDPVITHKRTYLP